MTETIDTRYLVGTVDLPNRGGRQVPRDEYFRALNYLELSALFHGPLTARQLAGWKSAPTGGLGIIAPAPLTHRKLPANNRWPASEGGDFRIGAQAPAGWQALVGAVAELQPAFVVFRSPPLFAASTANRETLKKFFTELATAEALGPSTRVWVPDGLWDARTALAIGDELGLAVALDPLIREPGTPAELYFELDVERPYWRVSGLGRSGPLSSDSLDELASLMEHHGRHATLVFESAARWADAKNLMKLLGES